MVVGLFSSAAAPAPAQGLEHEEAQATDRASELPQLFQPQAQIGAEAWEVCGAMAKRRSGYNSDSERTSGAGEAGVSETLHLVLCDFQWTLFFSDFNEACIQINECIRHFQGFKLFTKNDLHLHNYAILSVGLSYKMCCFKMTKYVTVQMMSVLLQSLVFFSGICLKKKESLEIIYLD